MLILIENVDLKRIAFGDLFTPFFFSNKLYKLVMQNLNLKITKHLILHNVISLRKFSFILSPSCQFIFIACNEDHQNLRGNSTNK